MERLTESNPSWIDDELWERACEPDCEEIDAVYRKLKDYEDLEERLNKVYGDCDGLLLSVIEALEKHSSIDIANKTLKSRLLTDEDVDKWEEYKQLEEQGRLVKLPCKVGDKVYQISENFIEPCTVETIFLGNYTDRNGNCCNMAEIYYDRDDCPYVTAEIYFTDIGKTVFLTKSEAEAKLKEMRDENVRGCN